MLGLWEIITILPNKYTELGRFFPIDSAENP